MDQEIIEKIDQQVFRQFPYLKGIEPEISTLEGDQLLLVYKGKAMTANGHDFPIIVRVVIDSAGKVLKITSSR